jgi:hypothetical protein
MTKKVRLHTANEIFTVGGTDTTFVSLVMPLDCTAFLHTAGAILTSVLTGIIFITIITYATKYQRLSFPVRMANQARNYVSIRNPIQGSRRTEAIEVTT